MTEEQLRLMAKVLICVVGQLDLYASCYMYGANVGQCRYCHAIGEIHHSGIAYHHKDECFVKLAEQLVKAIEEKPEEPAHDADRAR